MVATVEKDGSTNFQRNYCFMAKDGTLSIVEQVTIMIHSNNFSMHVCEPYLERLNDTCVAVLSDYNEPLDEQNIATQELYHLRGRLKDKRLKVAMIEKDLLLEKDA